MRRGGPNSDRMRGGLHDGLLAWAVVGLTLASASVAAAEWIEVSSRHFRVISDQPVDDARRIASDLERMRLVFAHGQIEGLSDPARPVVVVLVRDPEELSSWLPRYAEGARPGGAFLSGPYAHYMVLTLDEGPHAAYHEYVHLVSRVRLGPLPRWLAEGLAEFYANTEFAETRARVGQPPASALAYVRRRPGLGLPELVRGDDDRHSTGDPRDVQSFYTASWALTHYLLLGRDEPTPGATVSAYLTRLGNGDDPVSAFQGVIGPFDEVETAVRRHMGQFRFPRLELEIGPAVASRPPRVRALPGAEAQAERAVVLAASGHGGTATELIRRLKPTAPASAHVAEAEGQVHLLVRDTAAAARAFDEAIRLGSESFVPFHAAATMTPDLEPGPERDRKIELLRQAVRLNPGFAPAQIRLAELLGRDDDLSGALAAARRAVTLQPTQGRVWALLGRVLLRLGDVDGARNAVAQGYSWAHDRESRFHIETFSRQLARHVSE